MSSEFILRPFDDYDPDEPLVITYGDLLAARNAVGHLVLMLNDRDDPPSQFRQESIRVGVRFAVSRSGEEDRFETLEEAVAWLTRLRDRLGSYLPSVPPAG
jgi:hypothetical protein